jgi:nitrile hydratase accessory protein
MAAERQMVQMADPIAMPRQNGELVFAAPWEARAFGMAVVLNEQGHYAWRAFSQELAAETATAEQHGLASTYYERWQAALEKLVTTLGLVTPEELDRRMAAYAAGDDEHHTPHDSQASAHDQ